jgi:hypothetical protein
MTTTASQDYALPNDWQLAAERLTLLETCHDPATFRRAQALSVGWSCLEAGEDADGPVPRVTLTAPNDGTTSGCASRTATARRQHSILQQPSDHPCP